MASYPEVSVVDPDEVVVSVVGIAVACFSPTPRRNGTGTAAAPFGVSPPRPLVNNLPSSTVGSSTVGSSTVGAWRDGSVLPAGRKS
jgi:hypothetical protein